MPPLNSLLYCDLEALQVAGSPYTPSGWKRGVEPEKGDQAKGGPLPDLVL